MEPYSRDFDNEIVLKVTKLVLYFLFVCYLVCFQFPFSPLLDNA